MSKKFITRRQALVLATALVALTPGLTLAQAKPKVAGIYTVPFEQQWAGRLHTALKAAEARGDIEYKASENVSNACLLYTSDAARRIRRCRSRWSPYH